MSAPTTRPRRLGALLRCLRRDDSAISMVEFAITLPFWALLSVGGLEVANMVTINMQASQLALSVADNASRLGQAATGTPSVDEGDIAAVMSGAAKSGASIKLAQNGRIILSSLEIKDSGVDDDPSDDTYYIHWQRCSGSYSRASAYGAQGTVLTQGMGRSGAKLLPISGTADDSTDVAVMYAEVYYQYQPLFANFGLGRNMVFRQEAAFMVRDNRNYSNTVNPGGATVLNC